MNELTIHLQGHEKKSLYEQIYQYIKEEIRDGNISCGEKLPSTRLLSSNLQVSRSTVDMAYGQLLAEGYIESQPCRGYYVCNIEELYDLKEEPEKPEITEVVKKEYKIDFSLDKIDYDYFPVNDFRKANKEVFYEGEQEIFGSGNKKGELPLREAIQKYLFQARGVNCTPGQIVVGAGNEYLLMLLLQILGTHMVAAMENPTYRNAYETFRSFGCAVESVKTDRCGMDVESLRKSQGNVAYVMPSHQFPLGTVMPMKRRLELLSWAAEEEHRYIIEDDYDSEYRYKGKPIPALYSNDLGENVIYIGTFSKSIAPSIRVSFMVLPKKLLKVYQERCMFGTSTVSKITQKTLVSFINSGAFERHLNRMRNVYKGKRDLILEMLKDLPKECRVYGEDAGLYLLVELPPNRTEESVVEHLKEKSIRVYGLKEFLIKEQRHEYPATILIGFGGLSPEKIKKGMEAFTKILHE